jgi:ribose transport system substrate-binding protein
MHFGKSYGTLLLALGLLGAGISGCQKSASPGGGAASSANQVIIAVIPKGTANSYWLGVKAGAEAAGRERGVKIDFDGPKLETDITGQINLVEDKINAGVKGIVLAACDTHALLRPVEDALHRGIPVVTIDSGLDPKDDPSYCYIATNNEEGGKKAADALAAAIGEKGKVGILGFLQGAASNDDRLKGFNEEIKKYPGITVVTTLYDDSDTGKAVNQTANMLTAHPDISGIFAANQPGGVGAANYLRQSGLVGKVKIVAFDASDDEINDLKQGIIQALIVQNPYQMGYQGVMEVLNALAKKPAPQPRFIDSGVTVVTQQNMNDPQIQKLLHPGSS